MILQYLILSALLFTIGATGIFVNRKNIISIMMSIEIMLLAVSFNFVTFSYYLNDVQGQVFVIFILTVAAAEAAIGLAIMMAYFRQKKNIELIQLNSMRG